MPNNIYSSYFSKILFSFIDEKIKLDIIKYNKAIQASLNISLINYKVLSGKYIIKQSNGFFFEYNGYEDDLNKEYKLLFKGEYLNGKRNGIGKEYYQNFVVFEGEYLNGKRNGKGKEYDSEGEIRFEGEYLNGDRWYGKGYDSAGKNIYTIKNGNGYVKIEGYNEEENYKFEGEYLNGKKSGLWKEYYYDELFFEGQYLKGKRNGQGKEYNIDNYNLIFEGEYFNDKRWNGICHDKKGNIIYTLKNGKRYVNEEFRKSNALIYEGDFLYGEKNGKGKEYRNDGQEKSLLYDGEYVNGKKNGKGKIYYHFGRLLFDGEFLYDKTIKGKKYDMEEGYLEYDGEFLYDKKMAKGKDMII